MYQTLPRAMRQSRHTLKRLLATATTARSPLFSRRSIVQSLPPVTRYPTIRYESNSSVKVPRHFVEIGMDFQHFIIYMHPSPAGEGATKEQIIDCYIKTLAKVLGSEEEAEKKIYKVSCGKRRCWFGCEIDEKTADKLYGLPGVKAILPDSYIDVEYKDYGDELLVNGKIVHRSLERQKRIEGNPEYTPPEF